MYFASILSSERYSQVSLDACGKAGTSVLWQVQSVLLLKACT